MNKKVNRNKELAFNSLIFSIGNIGTKFVMFFLVPLHTSVLTTQEYGIADLVNTTISLLFPVLTLGFCEAVMRFIITNKGNAKGIFITSIVYSVTGTLVTGIIAFAISRISVLGDYAKYLPVLFLVNSIHRMLQQYSKGIEKNLCFAIDGILCALLQVIFTVFFLVYKNLGVKGYLYSLILAYFISSFFLFFTCDIPKELLHGVINKTEIKHAKKYGVPLMTEEVSWWVIQGSDRYMVSWICGAAMNGLYSVAYKIPALFNVLVTVFVQAFSITVFKELDEKHIINGKADVRGFNKIYSMYLACTFIFAAVVIFITKPIAHIILQKEFYNSWIYTPMLISAFAIGNLQNFYGAIYKGLKKSRQIFVSTLVAAVVNVVMNFVLIYQIGAMGASIASVLSYIVIYIIRVCDIQKFVIMNHQILKCIISIILIIAISIFYIQENVIGLVANILIFMILIFIYRFEMFEIINVIYSFVNKNRL